MAYEYAKKLKESGAISRFPDNWRNEPNHGHAGKDWLAGFLHRHPEITRRKPEAASLSRTTAFNLHTVACFYGKLKEVLVRYNFEPQNIYNMDESGLSTVQKPTAVIASRDMSDP